MQSDLPGLTVFFEDPLEASSENPREDTFEDSSEDSSEKDSYEEASLENPQEPDLEKIYMAQGEMEDGGDLNEDFEEY